MTWERPHIEHLVPTKWGWMVSYPEGFVIGEDVDIGAFTYIQAEAGVEIKYDVQIGSHCAIYSVNSEDNTRGKIRIKEGTRIGSHTTIMPGVTIGAYARIGAHSFVKCDIPAGETWGGVPARRLK